MSVINTRGFVRFWPVLWTITHRFGAPKQFPLLLNPKVRLRVGHQHSQFWPILARFMDYYSLFWGPRVISTINKSWDAFTFQSSTLPILADSGLFHGVLLTVLGSQSDYHDYKTLGCVYMSVINTRSFGRFWAVSWTITHCFGFS